MMKLKMQCIQIKKNRFLVLNEVLNKMKRDKEKTCKIIRSVPLRVRAVQWKFQF